MRQALSPAQYAAFATLLNGYVAVAMLVADGIMVASIGRQREYDALISC